MSMAELDLLQFVAAHCSKAAQGRGNLLHVAPQVYNPAHKACIAYNELRNEFAWLRGPPVSE